MRHARRRRRRHGPEHRLPAEAARPGSSSHGPRGRAGARRRLERLLDGLPAGLLLLRRDHGLRLDGINAHKNWQDYLADTSAVARFVETGALWMLGYDEAQNAAMVERLAKFGVGADVLDEAAMGERFPLINCDPMPKFDAEGNEVDQGLGAFSAVYEHGCGHMDSSTCLEDLHRACVRDGVDFRFKTKVAKFTLDGGRCTGAQLADGSASRRRLRSTRRGLGADPAWDLYRVGAVAATAST